MSVIPAQPGWKAQVAWPLNPGAPEQQDSVKIYPIVAWEVDPDNETVTTVCMDKDGVPVFLVDGESVGDDNPPRWVKIIAPPVEPPTTGA